MSEPYIGEIRPFALSFAPQGWLACDGTQVPIPMYQALYAIIGDTYGRSDYRTYFTLPNLRGAATTHWGTPAPGWPYISAAIGQTYGANAVTADLNNFAPHNHALSMASAKPNVSMQDTPGPQQVPFRPFNTTAQKAYKGWSNATPSAAKVMAPNSIGVSGVVQPDAHENRQPFLAFRFCIAWEGVFPVHD
jgi:microcystin-dependent protein